MLIFHRENVYFGDSDIESTEIDSGSEPFGPGSAEPLEDGSAPGPEYVIKGKKAKKIYHPV